MHVRQFKNNYILAFPRYMPIKSSKIFCHIPVILLTALFHISQGRADEAPAKVNLAHQWKAGQKWTYGMEMTGKMDVRFPSNVPTVGRMSFKGIDFTLSNALMLDVLRTNDKNEGSVAMRFDDIAMRAGTASGYVEMSDEQMQVFVNGKPFGQPTAVQLDSLRHPSNAFRFSPQARFLGTEPIPGARAAEIKLPPHLQNLMRAFDLSLLPAIWPGKPVAPGDEWTNEVLLPLATVSAEEKRAGTFRWTYIGEQADAQNADRKVQRLRLDGAFKIRSEQATRLAAQIGDTTPGTPQDTIQKLSGDVLFDSQIGQVREADLKLQFYSARQAQSEVRGRTIDDSSWTIFDGSLRLKLQEAE